MPLLFIALFYFILQYGYFLFLFFNGFILPGYNVLILIEFVTCFELGNRIRILNIGVILNP